MKNIKLKLAVLGAFSVLSAQAMATGFLSLPAAGLSVAAGANQPAGTTAYVRCNTTGNYGSDPAGYTAPTTGANNTCAVFPASIDATPVTGFSLVSLSNITNAAITANGETLKIIGDRPQLNDII